MREIAFEQNFIYIFVLLHIDFPDDLFIVLRIRIQMIRVLFGHADPNSEQNRVRILREKNIDKNQNKTFSDKKIGISIFCFKRYVILK